MKASTILLMVTAGVALCAASAVQVAQAQPIANGTSASPAIIDGVTRPVARWTMPRSLRELSGLAVTENGELLAHDDERGVVFVLDPKNGQVRRTFSLGALTVHDDFEGIAVAGSRIFLMTSAGRLYETREPKQGAVAQFTITETGLGQLCELEGLAYDPLSRDLLVGCKAPRVKYFREHVTVLRWSLDRRAPAVPTSVALKNVVPAARSGAYANTSYEITKSSVGLNGRSAHFSTSALEFDPKTSHIVLVSGIEKTLLEITHEGRIVAVRPLIKGTHRQPEALTFLGDSLLLVADEGGADHATISVYRREH